MNVSVMIGQKRILSTAYLPFAKRRCIGEFLERVLSSVVIHSVVQGTVDNIITELVRKKISKKRHKYLHKVRMTLRKKYICVFGTDIWPFLKKEIRQKAAVFRKNRAAKIRVLRRWNTMRIKLCRKKFKQRKDMHKRLVHFSKRCSSRRILTKVLGRIGDTRSVIAKALHIFLANRTQCHSIDDLQKIQLVRGDIETKEGRKHAKCLYCGQPGQEIDHFKSAVRNGMVNSYIDMPINRVPSCLTCHRAGKDTPGSPDDVPTWHRTRPARTNKNHPQLKMDRLIKQGVYTEADRKRVNEGVIRFDYLHKRLCPQISSRDLLRVQTSIENILAKAQKLYRDELTSFISKEPLFHRLLKQTPDNGSLVLT